MTRTQYKKFLEREIELLNRKIDLKIIGGIGYNDEARRHKMLRDQVKILRRRAFFGKLNRFAQAFALF